MNPIKPGTNEYPTAQALNVGLATADNKRRWQRTAKRINDVIRKCPHEKVSVPKDEAPTVRKQDKRTAQLTNSEYQSSWFARNADHNVSTELLRDELEILTTNSYRYDYQVDAGLMDSTMDTIYAIMREDLLNDSDFWTTRFWLNDFIDESYVDGTSDSFESAIRITDGTPVEANIAMLSATQQLQTPAYMDRLRLVHGRVFEEMKGLTGDMQSQLRLTLTEGVARGIGIRDLTGMINKRLSVGMSRAKRIARTEINRAYTDSYMSEAKELNETALKGDKYMIAQCQRSALSPTTRPSHAARHGNIYTAQQMQDWWAEDGNRVNCICSTLDVLVDRETGEVFQSKMIKRMKEQKKQWWPL